MSATIADLLQSLGSFAVTWLIQSAVLIGASLALLGLLKSRGRATQSVVLRITVIAVLVCPFASYLLGELGYSAGVSLAPASQSAPVIQAPSEIAASTSSRHASAPQTAVAPAVSGTGSISRAFLLVLGVAWAIGAYILLSKLTHSYFLVRDIRRKSTPAPHHVQQMCSELASVLTVPAPTVMLHADIDSPCLLGILDPVIVVPDESDWGNPDTLRFVLIHELAHLARHDCIWNFLGRALQAVLFFQPLAHILVRRMEDISDDVADDYVVEWGGGGVDYAAHLTFVAEQHAAMSAQLVGAGIMPFTSALGRRVQRILDTPRRIILYTKPLDTAVISIAGIVLMLATAATFTACQHVKSHSMTQSQAPAFVDDPAVVGKWESVDFVSTIDEFNPRSLKWQGDLYLKGFELMPTGRTSGPWSWSNGSLYHPGDKTTARYTIKEMDGARYMFFEWMSGDVTIRGMKPKYYVLKYAGESTAPAVPAGTTVDVSQYKSDTPPAFVGDPLAVGKWQSVDFVGEIGDFEPGVQKWTGDLYLKGFELMPLGRTSGPWSWSKGVLYHPGDLSLAHYTIKEMDGVRYMFFEWISGDVLFHGMKPQYYVLKFTGQSAAPAVPANQKVDASKYLSETQPAFVDDPQVIGKWQSVDFVGEIGDFEPGIKKWTDDLFLKDMEFRAGGEAKYLGFNARWTRGTLWNPNTKTLSAYTIKEMNGSRYLFFEWISGDVTIRSMKPMYYVFKAEN